MNASIIDTKTGTDVHILKQYW